MNGVPVAVQNVGWTYSATVQVIQVIVTLLLGSGGLYGIARGVALLWRMNNETKKQDTDAAAAVRREMMDLNDRQNRRIDTLEQALRDERKRCDEETDALRKAHISEMGQLRQLHAEEVRDLHVRMEGLHAQMVTMQQATGRAIQLGANAPKAAARIPDPDTGANLRQAFGGPETGDGK